MNDIEVLKDFLKSPPSSSDVIFERFLELPGANLYGEGKKRFLYLKGNRENKVLLVAHADTFWDKEYSSSYNTVHEIIEENGIIYSSKNSEYGLGADDRAGCAMLWLLRNLGHSLLITDGEEKGQKGSNWFIHENKDIADEINHVHNFIIQFDRCNGSDFKCYHVGTEEFREYLRKKTGYSEPDRKSRTDIVTLCKKIAGVNLSIGYHKEHTAEEFLCIEEWLNALNLYRKWLAEKEIPKFIL